MGSAQEQVSALELERVPVSVLVPELEKVPVLATEQVQGPGMPLPPLRLPTAVDTLRTTSPQSRGRNSRYSLGTCV